MRTEDPQATATLARMLLREWVVAGFLFAIGASVFGLLLALVAAFLLILLGG